MTMVKKSISITDRQDGWLKEQLASGHYGNESEIIRDLIRDRQMVDEELADPKKIEAIRAALKVGEVSGMSNRTVDEIWEEVIKRKRQNGIL